jgi:hypothetical protein
MQSHYSINVAKDGLHFFSTAEQSGVDRAQVRRTALQLMKHFTAADGFTVTITHWEVRGREVKLTAL